MSSLGAHGPVVAMRAVSTAQAAEIAHHPYQEIHRALMAVAPYHPLWGKRVGGRFKVRVDELLRWMLESPHPRDRERAEELMAQPKMEARVFDLKTAALAYSVSATHLKKEIEMGRLRAKRVADTTTGKYLVSIKDLDAWFDALPDA